MKSLAFILILAGSASGHALRPLAQGKIANLRPTHRDRVGAVVRYGGGTGFVVYREQDGADDVALVLTNKHVAGGARFAAGRSLRLADGNVAETTRLIATGVADHALVQVRLPRAAAVRPVPLELEGPKPNQRTYTVGSAHYGHVFAAGLTDGEGEREMEFGSSDLSGSTKSRIFSQTSANRSGMSGSPVMAVSTDKVVGIHNGGRGSMATLVSMKRVIGEIEAAPLAPDAKPLVDRMLAFQRAGAHSAPTTIKAHPTTTYAMKNDASREDIEKLGWMQFGTANFSGGERKNLAIHTAEGKVAAFATYERRNDVLYVNYIATDPRHEGHGLCAQLLDELARVGRTTPGVRAISLDVDVDNATARRLYAGHGFKEVKESYGEKYLELAL